MPTGNTDPRNTAAYKQYAKEGTPYREQMRFYKGKFIPVGKWENIMAGNLDRRAEIQASLATPAAPTTPSSPTGPVIVNIPPLGSPTVPPHIPSGPYIPPGGPGQPPVTGSGPYIPPGGPGQPPIPGKIPPSTSTKSGTAGTGGGAPGGGPGTESNQGYPGQPTGGANTTPPWWINKAYQNPTEEQAFANAANALLPTLSPEDQRTLATYLATNYKDAFGAYANANFAPIPSKLTNERNQYLSPARTQQAVDLLNRMKAASGGKPLGKGFDFLMNAVQLMNRYTTPGMPMTREKYAEFSNAIKALTASMGSDVSAYKNLATLFNMPTFTAGPLVSNAPNAQLNT